MVPMDTVESYRFLLTMRRPTLLQRVLRWLRTPRRLLWF